MSEEKSNRKKVSAGIILIILLVSICGVSWWAIDLRKTLTTDNAKVVGDLVDVSARVSGNIDKLYVEEGQAVKAGQILAKLDDEQYQINLEQAKAALHLAQASYAKLPDDVKSANATVEKSMAGLAADEARYKAAQVALDDAKRQLEENRSLYESGAISKEAFYIAESNYTRAQSGLDVAVANVEASKAGLNDAQAKAVALNHSGAAIYLAQIEQAEALFKNAQLAEDHTRIFAAVDGTVLRIPISSGENVLSGQTLMTISNLNSTWVTANIQEKSIGRVKIGQKVDIRLDAYPGKSFSGTVIEVGNNTQSTFALIPTEGSSGNFTKVAQRLSVKVKVNNAGVTLKPGMSALVKIHTRA